jgi:hypothetical protein
MDTRESVDAEMEWIKAANEAGRRLPVGLERSLALLPARVEAWAISNDAAALCALAGDAIFTVTAVDHHFAVASRPLIGEWLVVDHERGPSRLDDRGGIRWSTRWTFRYANDAGASEPWQQMSGQCLADERSETCDEREAFARAVAARVGWSVQT